MDESKDLTPEDYKRLEQENELLKKKIRHLEDSLESIRERLRRAKNPEPVERASFRRLKQLAHLACLKVARVGRKVRVSLGEAKHRLFKSMREAWDFLSQEDWKLEELFPPPAPPKPKRKNRAKPCHYCGRHIYWKWDGKAYTFNADDHQRHYCNEYYQRRQSFHEKITQGGDISIPFE